MPVWVLQLQMYKERYDEFQTTIKKSEEMFGKFKTEMDKVGTHVGVTETAVLLSIVSLLVQSVEQMAAITRVRGLITNRSRIDP